MAVDKIPADVTLHNRVGRAMIRSKIERGDTVTFSYEGEQRTVLVLENDGIHLKGIDKLRDGDFRNFLFRKIVSVQYAKPFVKAVPVTTVKFEMLPEPKTKIESATKYGGNLAVSITKPNGEFLNIFAYADGRIGLCGTGINTSNVDAKTFFNEISKMAE